MTREARYNVKCKRCNVEMVCPQCGEKTNSMTPFSDWLRKQSGPLSSKFFDSENLDYIWLNYRQGWMITIEEKRYGATPTEAQTDTHNIIRQMLEYASSHPVDTWRGRRPIEYRGHYVLSFENTSPDDSKWIRINGKMETRVELATNLLLSTGRPS